MYMKKITKIILSVFCAAMIALPALAFVACDKEPGTGGGGGGTIDYVSELKLDMTSDTKKQEVTVKMYIDGDTTHFYPVKTWPGYNAADFAETDGYIKARYLAVDTPESTGNIEKWGKAASNFTHDKLYNAKSIIVESDNNKWNIDSTGERYTLWIWYMPSDGTEYRNLNVEILQNGYAFASATASNRYGEVAMAALEQARAAQLHVYAPDHVKDPLYYDGDVLEVDLMTLRFKIATYDTKKVRVQGVVTARFENTVYIEDSFYDEKTGETYYCGMPVYYGFQAGKILTVLSVGNRVEIVGSVTQFAGGWQISGVHVPNLSSQYDPATDSKLISDKDNFISHRNVTAKEIIDEKNVTRTVNFTERDEDGKEIFVPITLSYAESALSTTVTVSELYVMSYTTTQSGDNKGAISLKCRASDNTEITIRTTVLYNEDKTLVTGEQFKFKTITVTGLVDKYIYDYTKNPDDYQFQVKVYDLANIVVS